MMNKLSRGALLLALAVVFQALRLFIPLPLQVSTLIIGTLVHAMLLLSYHYAGLNSALLMGCVLPVLAYFQGQLLLPILIPLVIVGNWVFVILLASLKRKKCFWILPPLGKALVMGIGAYVLLVLFQFGNPAMRKVLLFGMSVPQLLTGIAGIVLGSYIIKRYKNM